MTPTLAVATQLLIAVESGGNPKAFNERENAAGILQIRPIMVQEVNRITGHECYSLEDRWVPQRSVDMAEIYFHYHAQRLGRPLTISECALLWCAGGNALEQPRTPAMGAYLNAVERKALELLRYVELDEFKKEEH